VGVLASAASVMSFSIQIRRESAALYVGGATCQLHRAASLAPADAGLSIIIRRVAIYTFAVCGMSQFANLVQGGTVFKTSSVYKRTPQCLFLCTHKRLWAHVNVHCIQHTDGFQPVAAILASSVMSLSDRDDIRAAAL